MSKLYLSYCKVPNVISVRLNFVSIWFLFIFVASGEKQPVCLGTSRPITSFSFVEVTQLSLGEKCEVFLWVRYFQVQNGMYATGNLRPISASQIKLTVLIWYIISKTAEWTVHPTLLGGCLPGGRRKGENFWFDPFDPFVRHEVPKGTKTIQWENKRDEQGGWIQQQPPPGSPTWNGLLTWPRGMPLRWRLRGRRVGPTRSERATAGPHRAFRL